MTPFAIAKYLTQQSLQHILMLKTLSKIVLILLAIFCE